MKWFTRIVQFMRPTMPTTVDEIVAHIKKNWSKSDLECVTSGGYYMGMITRRIRNDYGLWSPEHPLTKNWAKNSEMRDIRNGIDYSEDHPDNISGVILDALRRSL